MIILLTLMVLAVAGPAMAQDPDKRATFNFEGGYTFSVSEVRDHYIWGSELTDSAGKSYGKANSQFFPITAGIRF